MNKSNADAQENIRRYKDAKALQPEYMRFNSKDDVDNKTGIRSGISRNTLRMVPTCNDAVSADKAGRGLTSSKIWFDEAAFIKFINIIYSISGPIRDKASEAAKRNRVPYGTALTSTPNFLDCVEGEFYYNLLSNSVKFSELMYDMPMEEIYNYVYENSTNDLCYIKFTWQELGKDEKWYENQCRQIVDRVRVKRELDLEWTFAVDNTPFEEEELERLSSLALPARDTIKIDKSYSFDIYQEIDFTVPYPVGVDVSGGLGQDFSCLHVVHPKTDKTVANFYNNKISTEQLKVLISKVGRWLPFCFFIIERNSYGLAIIQSIMEDSKYAFLRSRIFYTIKEEDRNIKSGKADVDVSAIQVKKKKSKVFGVNTSKDSRDLYMDLLNDFVVNNPEVINCKEVFEQIKTLEIKSNGKIEHRKGFHDDILFARLFVAYAKTRTTWRRFTKNYTEGNKAGTEMMINQYKYHNVLEMQSVLSPISANILQINKEIEKAQHENKYGKNSIISKIRDFNR